MASSNGNFVWYDLMSTDAKAAEAFYRGVVGWRMQDAGMPDRSYTILSAGETAPMHPDRPDKLVTLIDRRDEIISRLPRTIDQ